MSQNLTVEMLNLETGEVMLSDRTICPITKYMDDTGEACHIRHAVACVAGPDLHGNWHSVDLSLFNMPTYH